jgi:hypothetical protein
MTPERFKHLSAIHGADLERWPDGERAAAARLMRADGDLRHTMAEEALVDDALRHLAHPVDDERAARVERAVLDRIAVATVDPATLPWHPPRSLWPALGLLIGMGLLGFAAGGVPAAEADTAVFGLDDLIASESLTLAVEP